MSYEIWKSSTNTSYNNKYHFTEIITSFSRRCIEHEQVSDVIDDLQIALTKEEIQEKLRRKMELNQLDDKVHNVSACHLPKSRQIIQRRYQ